MSLLNTIAKRNIEMGSGTHFESSLEADEIDILSLADESVESAFQNVDGAISLALAVDKLSDHFISRGISEESLEDYKIAVEAILLTSGIDTPASLIVPSFEDGVDKAKSKKEGVVARIKEWIREWMAKIAAAVKKFFGITKMKFAESTATLDSIKKELAKLSDTDKPQHTISGRVRHTLVEGSEFKFSEVLPSTLAGLEKTWPTFIKVIDDFSAMDYKRLADNEREAFGQVAGPLNGCAFIDIGKITVKSNIEYNGNVRLELLNDIRSSSVADLKRAVNDLEKIITIVTDSISKVTTKFNTFDKTMAAHREKVDKASDRFRKAMDNPAETKEAGDEFFGATDELIEVKHLQTAVEIYKNLYNFSRDLSMECNSFTRNVLVAISLNVNCYKVSEEKENKK